MQRKKLLWSIFVALVFSATTISALAEEARPAYREGEVIVKYRDGAVRPMAAMDDIYERAAVLDIKRFHGVLKNFEHITIDTSKQSVESTVADLERNPSVEYAQPNYIIYAHDFMDSDAHGEARAAHDLNALARRPPVNPLPAGEPVAADPSLHLAWGVYKTGANKAWAQSDGSRKVVVAVIDTGVDYNHPDLIGNMWRNPNHARTQATGVDAEASGISGDVVGWDFVHNDNLPFDDKGHGTHVAGTIGAVGRNGKGLSGISQRVSILAVKFLGANGSGDTAAAIRGIDYAISRGAKVLNNSWGGRGGANTALIDAMQRSANAGAIFVASAGNDGTDNDTYFSFPASFEVSNMITVAATNSSDAMASFSNRGARTVHMGAPGVSIYSTLPGGRYGYMSGTSMAAPHVSGAAALVWAAHPNWSASQVKERLIQSGTWLSSLQGKTISGRRLDVLEAVR